jgi:hypothetical protein
MPSYTTCYIPNYVPDDDVLLLTFAFKLYLRHHIKDGVRLTRDRASTSR